MFRASAGIQQPIQLVDRRRDFLPHALGIKPLRRRTIQCVGRGIETRQCGFYPR